MRTKTNADANAKKPFVCFRQLTPIWMENLEPCMTCETKCKWDPTGKLSIGEWDVPVREVRQDGFGRVWLKCRLLREVKPRKEYRLL